MTNNPEEKTNPIEDLIYIPEHAHVNENHEAIAPYNFVPLPEKVITFSVNELPDQGEFLKERMTGHIDCELTTSSPVFVRAGLTPEQAKDDKKSKNFPGFFYLDDKNQPVIPGSSLRGMLRTLVEIVSFSKIGAVSKSRLVYRSVGGTTNHDAHYRDQMMRLDREEKVGTNTKYYTPLMRGGYLVKKGARDWEIQPAKVIDNTTYAHIGIDPDFFRKLKRIKNCQNAFEIYINTGPYQYQEVRGGFLKIKFAKVVAKSPTPQPGLRPAALAQSGWMNSKKSEAVIYERDTAALPLPLSDEQIDDYMGQISKEQQKLLGNNGVLNDEQPVFYTLDEQTGKVIFFGHTRMFRVPYPRSPFDYVPDYSRPEDEFANPDEVDFTEAIFGYTRKNGEGKQRSYAGRVFCSDAKIIEGQDNYWLSVSSLIPQILSGPKPTTFQHYLVQTDPDLYPIGQTKDGATKFETRLRDFGSPTPGETVIRGHKFYWHKGPVGLENISEKGQVKENDQIHTRICPIKEGVRFHFRVSFDNLSQEELGALLWVFDIAAHENIRLKIGMGKPLGMGAISIKPTLFIKNVIKRYTSLINDEKWESGLEQANDLIPAIVSVFKARMLKTLNEDLDPKDQVDDLLKVKRIRALLYMLQWPGPDKELTRYMEIEHPDPRERKGKRNEYKDRPVLPSPINVWRKRGKS